MASPQAIPRRAGANKKKYSLRVAQQARPQRPAGDGVIGASPEPPATQACRGAAVRNQATP